MKEIWQHCVGINNDTGELVYRLYVEGKYDLLVNSAGEEVSEMDNVSLFDEEFERDMGFVGCRIE